MEMERIKPANLNTAQMEQLREAEKLINARENNEVYLIAVEKSE